MCLICFCTTRRLDIHLLEDTAGLRGIVVPMQVGHSGFEVPTHELPSLSYFLLILGSPHPKLELSRP